MPEIKSWHIAMLSCAAMTILWLLYMLRIGGGYAEFRMLVPVAPLLFILIVGALRGLRGARRPVAMATAALLVCASFYHQYNYRQPGWPGLPLPSPSRFLTLMSWDVEPDAALMSAGKALRELFAKSEDYPAHIKIATTAGGHLPFYSRLYTLEMHGFTDPRILLPGNHEITEIGYPGHQFVASQRLLLALDINLVFNHPLIVPADVNIMEEYDSAGLFHHFLSRFLFRAVSFHLLPRNMQIVEIPIGGDKKLIGLYLTRNEKLDAILRERNITVYDFPPPAG